MKQDCFYTDVCTQPTCANCLRYAEMKFLVDNSGIPEGRRKPAQLMPGCDYEQFLMLADIKDSIQEFVQDGKNLYICSNETGNGKTSWAIKLLLKYFDCIWAGNGYRVAGKFVHVPSWLTRIKDFDNGDYIKCRDMLFKPSLVVWDDIAATKLSDYDISQLLMVIDERTSSGKSNIYTGNLVSRDALERVVGSRLASRVWNTSTVVTFNGRDRR